MTVKNDEQGLFSFPPRCSLGFFPTPLHPLTALANHLGGPEIYIKRDDLTGLALGGNKTRKLEFLLGDALEQKADTLITGGASQSNHCRQTAAAAIKYQFHCHLMLGGEPPKHFQGNLLLDELLGAEIHWCGRHRKGEDIPDLVKELQERGYKPYVIPYGGSSVIGAFGFAQAFDELRQQSLQNSVGEFSHIFFASSSGATHAGLQFAKHVLGSKTELIGINIDKESSIKTEFYPSLKETICELANGMNHFSNHPSKHKNQGEGEDGCLAENAFQESDIQLIEGYDDSGYGELNKADKKSLQLLAQKEAILLDPVYTSRAMTALLDWIQSARLTSEDKVLFWHTGGVPSVFAYQDMLKNI